MLKSVLSVPHKALTLCCVRAKSSVVNVFDRRSKLLQRERAAAMPDVDNYDFLKEEVGYRVSDRVLDVARKMEVAVDVGSGRGWVTRHLTEHSVGRVTAIELRLAFTICRLKCFDQIAGSGETLSRGIRFKLLTYCGGSF